ncbi:MAG: phage portal protein [Synechococcus sp.]|nr:phage portal protein [Synechococcus sp.]
MIKILSGFRSLFGKSISFEQAVQLWTRGYDSAENNNMTEAYKNSVWVNAAIKAVTAPIKGVSLRFYANEEDLEDNNPVVQWWQNPAVNMSQTEFVEAVGAWQKLAGESFWILDDTWFDSRAQKSKLIVARPTDMRHIVQGSELVGWSYTDNGGAQHNLLPEEVIQIKQWNPYNPWRGLGELDAAKIAVETDYAAGRYARDTFRNAGDAGAYVTSKGAMPSEAQQAQIVAALREKRAARLRGDYRPVFLAGDIAVTDPKVQSPDQSFVSNRQLSRHEIFIAFGVPASMADVMASYSIGSASDMFRLISNTCVPLAETIARGINAALQLQYGNNPAIRCYFDWDEHPTMQAVRRERIDAAVKLWNMGMPLDKVNDYLEMELPEFNGWDRGYLPSTNQNRLPIENESEANEDNTPDASDAYEIIEDAFRERASLNVSKTNAPEAVQRATMWNEMIQGRTAAEKSYLGKWSKALQEARVETIAKLNKHASMFGTGQKAVSNELIFAFNPWNQKLKKRLRPITAKILADAVNEANAQAAKAKPKKPKPSVDPTAAPAPKPSPWKMPPENAIRFIQQREKFIDEISDEIHKGIMSIIEQGMIKGQPASQIADDIRKEFNQISNGRAKRIARTETGAAYGYAREQTFEANGIQYKEWLSTPDDRCRATHKAADGQVVEINRPFKVGQASLMFPCDPSGPPEEIINCRCVQIAVSQP